MSEIPGDLKFLKVPNGPASEATAGSPSASPTTRRTCSATWSTSNCRTSATPVQAGNACAVVESVKAASDVYAPVSGTVVEVNSALADKPETINEDAYGDGWLFTLAIDDAEQLNELLGPDDYAELLEDEDH